MTQHQPAAEPPEGLPRYRILTGPDDDAFCHRVSEAIEMGYVLYGSPALAANGESVIAAQALIWSGCAQSPALARRSGATSVP